MQTTTMKDQQISSEDRRLIHRILLDFIILTLLCMPLIICEYIIEPFRRGFFCSDETIRYPFRDNTITLIMLALFVTLLPAIIVITVEYTHYYRCGRTKDTLLLFGRNVPVWIVEFFKHASYYLFGALLTFNATELGKFTIGRLRPHFISVCQPQLADGSTCDAPQNLYRYVEDYSCAGVGYTRDDVRQARLSFPSGHSSLSFYAMIFLIIYLQYKFTWRGSRFSRYFLQFSLLMLAWFTALSRVIDNWHHWSDVLCGSLLGILGAVITAIFINKDFRTPLLQCLNANLPHQNSTNLKDSMATLPSFTQRHEVA
ncbi:putative phosphatidate phosphatase isoform X3 [Eurosta solidaginis]|uniref:putative phosphatidate phosphatase isoform X3 n=1 Tax=Eurosta solidaginis TaxID=178769 RepID=UPI0035316C28